VSERNGDRSNCVAQIIGFLLARGTARFDGRPPCSSLAAADRAANSARRPHAVPSRGVPARRCAQALAHPAVRDRTSDRAADKSSNATSMLGEVLLARGPARFDGLPRRSKKSKTQH
jgi:hypothetical protein